MALPALAEAWAAGGDAKTALKLLAALSEASASGTAGREAQQAALKAFKAVQQRLAAPGCDASAAEHLAALGAACLAALAAAAPPPPQLPGWRYNFARRLVTCKAYGAAHAEARALFQQLGGRQEGAGGGKEGAGGGKEGATAPTAGDGEAANLMVGTVLTLLLSCVEGRLLGSQEAVEGALMAAERLGPLLSQLAPEEAARHSEAAYRYIYKTAVGQLEKKAWQLAVRSCAAMLAAAGGEDAAQRRALAAAGKLIAHMPEEHGAAAVAAMAAQAGGPSAGLSDGAANDLLGLLCSAAQRASSPAAAQAAQQAVEAAVGSQVPALQVAALLLPALALHLPAAAKAPGWAEAVGAAIRLVRDSTQQMEAQLAVAAGPSLPGSTLRRMAVLEAACLPANVLRRALASRMGGADRAAAAGSGGDVCRALGSPAGVALAAEALELLSGAAGVGSRLPSGQAGSSLAGQGHAAAVALVAAARLRAACLLQQPGPAGLAGGEELGSVSRAASSLLGWDLQSYCAGSSDLPPASCPVEPKELSWLASALFNVGVDLHAAQRYAAAVPALQAALAAAAAGLRVVAETEEGCAQGDALAAADFCRKCMALSDAQRLAGDPSGALSSLGHGAALLLQLGFTEQAAWQPLVQAFARLQGELPAEGQAADMPPAASAAGTAASRRGRAGAGKKGSTAAAAAKAAPAAASSEPAAAASELLLAAVLQQHEAQLPAGSIAEVLEQEVMCWGAAAQSSASPAAAAACNGRVARLLTSIFPAKQRPAEHAGVLLMLHRAGLPADEGQQWLALLERAVALLQKASGSPQAAAALAQAHCLLAVETGRQLARQTLLEQQQERQRSHAAASTSAAGSREQDAAVTGQLASGAAGDAAAWRRVAQHAQHAVDALRSARGSGAGSGSGQADLAELAWLLGLHGIKEEAQQLGELLPDSTAESGCSSGVLAGCIFPSAAASAAELQQQAEAAAGEASRSSTAVALQRASLHRQAAEACAAEGDMVPALYHASESHRLLAVLFHGSGEDASPAASSSRGANTAASPGWWQLAALYLGSLLQLGQLFEAAGQADEALHVLREGQRLAVALGSAPAAALFLARLADVYCKQGELAAAEQAASTAEQQLERLSSGSASRAVAYCRAAVQLARAQLGVAASGGCPGKAAWRACQDAAASCEELAGAAGTAGGAGRGWCGALHAAALLAAAEAAQLRGDAAESAELAAAAAAAAKAAGACSAARHQLAAALLLLGQHVAPAGADDEPEHLAVWGLGTALGAGSQAAAPAAQQRGRKAPARQPAGRGRSKASAAAASPEASGTADVGMQPHLRQLWRALHLSRGLLPVYRSAAALLAAECGRLGHLHLAAWLLHSCLGSAMRLQYQLVLFSRQQQLAQRLRRAGAGGGAAGEGDGGLGSQLQELQRLSDVLEPALDWQAVQLLAGEGGKSSQSAPAPGAKSRRAAGSSAARAAAAASSPDLGTALAGLDKQAQAQLEAWSSALPAGTAACSISALPGSRGGGSIVLCRLAPGEGGQAGLPPLCVALPVHQLSASLSQHPIRALRLDDDDGGSAGAGKAVSSVQSVLDEMAAVLADSGRSMRELATDTKEQQRKWWRARLALDDRLAALAKHLDSSWLGPWRCLLLGQPPGDAAPGQAAAEYLVQLLEDAGRPAYSQQAGVLRHAAAALAKHAGGMASGELRQAAHQLCHAAGLACSQEQQHQLERLLLQSAAAAAGGSEAAGGAAQQQQPAAAEDAAEPAMAASKPARKAGKSVKFADDPEPAAGPQERQQQQQENDAASVQPASRASRGRRPAAARGRRSAAADRESEVLAGQASPVATLGASGGQEAPPTGAQGGLCSVFGGLSLEEGPAPSTAGGPAAPGAARVDATTARSGKHRSRLRMLQAGTPGPATARKSRTAGAAAAAAAGGAATAPRPARELPLTVAKTAPPPAARHGGSGREDEQEGAEAAEAAAAGPVLLVLDGDLQALPWESAPGLRRQRLYRMPSLACAAASAHRSSTSVDLGSTFYALNPSGDLAATQATFQDWFRGMAGWEGKAGSAPSAAELAAALQRHAFFLYCGHGGGEQYISVTKLRSLERCSAALLMGCSSGRLRGQRHYEPSGGVLAYLLAGCPAAVANLWDVTDRDIDRFSQAVLTRWISGSGDGGGGSSSVSSGSSSTAARAPGGSSSRSGGEEGGSKGEGGSDMSAAVGASRGACKLPFLVGAAPVCYGLPSRLHFG